MNTLSDTDNPKSSSKTSAFTPSYYELCICGQLSSHIAAWFEDMTLTVKEDTNPPQTIIWGYIVDQAALYGLISRARDLGLILLSVSRLDEAEESEPQDFEGDAQDNVENSQYYDK